MTTDDRSDSPSEDLVRKAQESLGADPVAPESPVLPEGMVPAHPDSEPIVGAATDAPPEIQMPAAPANHRRGLVVAIAAAAAGAAVWAFILAYAEIQSWLLGIAIGYLVGLAAIRGAGAVTNQLRVIAVLLTFAAVIVGEVLGTAMLINKDFGIFDINLARRLYFDNLGGDFAFALGSAAVGALAVFFATKE